MPTVTLDQLVAACDAMAGRDRLLKRRRTTLPHVSAIYFSHFIFLNFFIYFYCHLLGKRPTSKKAIYCNAPINNYEGAFKADFCAHLVTLCSNVRRNVAVKWTFEGSLNEVLKGIEGRDGR